MLLDRRDESQDVSPPPSFPGQVLPAALGLGFTGSGANESHLRLALGKPFTALTLALLSGSLALPVLHVWALLGVPATEENKERGC